MATQASRLHALALMQYLIKQNALIGYSQVRPMATAGLYEQDLANKFAKGGVINPDCSEMTTLICRLAGYKDPSGLDYDGSGNTRTMFEHLGHVTDPSKAHVGGIVVFGVPELPQAEQHVAMVMVPGTDPQLFNHGSAAGPHEIAFSVLREALGNPSALFLNTGGL